MSTESRSSKRKLLGEILVEEGFLNARDIETALKVQKKDGGLIGRILVRMGLITEEDLVFALSKQLSIPYIRLGNYSVNRDALRLIPQEIAERYLFFPFEEAENTISLAMSDPLNTEALEAIEKRVPSRVQIFLATFTEIKDAIAAYYVEEIQAKEQRSGK